MSEDSRRILVTGGAGFIGSHVAEAYLNRGDSVWVLDDLSSGKRENLADGVQFVEADVGSDTARELIREVQPHIINHHAAQIDVRVSVDDPRRDARTNVDGFLNIVEGAREAGTRRFIFVSSGGVVYGEPDVRPTPEGEPKLPLSPYGVTKMVGEEYLRVYHYVYGLETVTLRYFNVFGARQAADSEYSAVIPIFLSRLFRGERPVIYGDGLQSRDFTYIDNVVEANMLAASAPAEKVAGRVMNAACGGFVTVKDLCLKLIEFCGSDLEPEYADPRPGDILHSHADISLAGELMEHKRPHPVADLRVRRALLLPRFRLSQPKRRVEPVAAVVRSHQGAPQTVRRYAAGARPGGPATVRPRDAQTARRQYLRL